MSCDYCFHIVYSFFVLFSVSTEPGTLISPKSKGTKKDENRKISILMPMLIAIASLSLLVAGTCCLLKKCVCKKERKKG